MSFQKIKSSFTKKTQRENVSLFLFIKYLYHFSTSKLVCNNLQNCPHIVDAPLLLLVVVSLLTAVVLRVERAAFILTALTETPSDLNGIFFVNVQRITALRSSPVLCLFIKKAPLNAMGFTHL